MKGQRSPFRDDGVVAAKWITDYTPFNAIGGNGVSESKKKSFTPDLTWKMVNPCLCAKDTTTGVMYSLNCLDGYSHPLAQESPDHVIVDWAEKPAPSHPLNYISGEGGVTAKTLKELDERSRIFFRVPDQDF